MKKILLLYISVLLISFKPQDNVSLQEKYRNYTNVKYQFEFKYPKEWEIANTTKFHEALVYEPDSGKNDSFMTNTSVIIEEHYDLSLDIRGELIEQGWKDSKQYKNIKILKKDKIKFLNFDAISYICTADVLKKKVKWKKVIFLKGKYIFDITLTGLEKDYNKLPKIVFESFQLN